MRIPYTFYIPPLKDPTALPNLIFWVRADLGITLASGNNVSGWADQSGSVDPNHNLAQTNAAKQPILNVTDAAYNNKSTVSFSRANDTFIQSPALWATPLSQPSTIYVVANSDGANVYYEDVFDGNAGGSSLRQQIEFNTGKWALSAGGAAASYTTNGTAGPHVFCAVFNGTANTKLYISSTIDSVLDTPTNTPNSALGMVVLGNSSGGGGLGLQGKIAEAIAYSGSHNATNRASVMRYLGSRYGIAIV